MSQTLTVDGLTPEVDPDAFVAPGATVAGNVRLAAGASVWFGCVVRSETALVSIGRDSNLQDLTMVHADPDFPTTVGERVTVGHRAVIHGCTIEDDVLVGMGAVVLNGAVLGQGSLVAAGTVVREGMEVPPMSLVAGVPGKVLEGRPVPEVPRSNVADYLRYAALYRDAAEA
jgi:carbonic anhydrase/acetyltransferase-like protein (isoleucine patch superfamily)